MVGMIISQCTNDHMTVLGLCLLGSGCTKCQVEVFAHAGLCPSYSTTMRHVKKLSAEGVTIYQQVARDYTCSQVWDNVNIPFTVGEQRLNSMSTFENGTTTTLIPLHDPENPGHYVPHRTLPLEMKPLRTTRRRIIDLNTADVGPTPQQYVELTKCCRWQLQNIAMTHIENLDRLRDTVGPVPEIDQIALHQTMQYPMRGMHLDESTIDGTIQVLDAIKETVALSPAQRKLHGLWASHGDLLSMKLADIVSQFKLVTVLSDSH